MPAPRFDPERLAQFNIGTEMAEAVAEAAVLGDLDKRLRDRIHKRLSRMSEKNELPQALAAEWSVAKADRTGAKQLSFLKLWLENNGGFGGGDSVRSGLGRQGPLEEIRDGLENESANPRRLCGFARRG